MTADKDGSPKIIKAFPEGAEREAINAVFDELVTELKRDQYFTHDEHAQPEPAPTPARTEPARNIPPDRPITQGDQLSFACITRQEKPSVMDKLAAAKAEVAKKGAAGPDTDKSKDKAHDDTQL